MQNSHIDRHNILPVAAATAVILGGPAVANVVAKPNEAPVPSMAGNAIEAGGFSNIPQSVSADTLAPYTAGPPAGTDYPKKEITTVIETDVEMPMSPHYGASANAHVLSRPAHKKVQSFVNEVNKQIKAGSHLTSNKIEAHASDDAADKLNGGAARQNTENKKLSHVRAHTIEEAENADFKTLGMHVKTDAHGDEKIRKVIERELAKLGKKEGKTVQEIIADAGNRTTAEQKILDKYTKDRGATMIATFKDVTHQPPEEQLSPPYVGHDDTQPVVHHDNPMMIPGEMQQVSVRVSNDAQYQGQALSHKAEAKAPQAILKAPRSHNMHDKGKASRTRARQHGGSPQKPLSRTGR
jgi:hypothetical protein